jgi:hypothetical protein
MLKIYLWQLLSNVTANEYGLQVDPQVLHNHPILDNLSCGRQLLDPLLNCLLEGRVVSVAHERAQSHQRVFHQRHNFARYIT